MSTKSRCNCLYPSKQTDKYINNTDNILIHISSFFFFCIKNFQKCLFPSKENATVLYLGNLTLSCKLRSWKGNMVNGSWVYHMWWAVPAPLARPVRFWDAYLPWNLPYQEFVKHDAFFLYEQIYKMHFLMTFLQWR